MASSICNSMNIRIENRSGKYLCSLEVPSDATADDLKKAFSEKQYYYPERQRFTIGSDQNIQDGTTLCFKDLGVQISWRLVFVLEYLGPLVLIPLFWAFPSFFYGDDARRGVTTSKTQVANLKHSSFTALVTLLCPLFDFLLIALIIGTLQYALSEKLLCGIGIGYYVSHPKFQPPFNDNLPFIYVTSALFLVFEALNFKTHLILRSLRPRGTKTRGIPQGWGFQWTSCANYTWEVGVWFTYACLTMTLTAFIFLLVAFGQMLLWALKKHSNYRRTFPNYPRKKKAIIPFLI